MGLTKEFSSEKNHLLWVGWCVFLEPLWSEMSQTQHTLRAGVLINEVSIVVAVWLLVNNNKQDSKQISKQLSTRHNAPHLEHAKFEILHVCGEEWDSRGRGVVWNGDLTRCGWSWDRRSLNHWTLFSTNGTHTKNVQHQTLSIFSFQDVPIRKASVPGLYLGRGKGGIFPPCLDGV